MTGSDFILTNPSSGIGSPASTSCTSAVFPQRVLFTPLCRLHASTSCLTNFGQFVRKLWT